MVSGTAQLSVTALQGIPTVELLDYVEDACDGLVAQLASRLGV